MLLPWVLNGTPSSRPESLQVGRGACLEAKSNYPSTAAVWPGRWGMDEDAVA
jgi:hypothetical protein